jgi:hypothetical protein
MMSVKGRDFRQNYPRASPWRLSSRGTTSTGAWRRGSTSLSCASWCSRYTPGAVGTRLIRWSSSSSKLCFSSRTSEASDGSWRW